MADLPASGNDDEEARHENPGAVPDPTSPDKCGSRSEIGGSSPVDPQTLDFLNPLFRVLCRQGVIMFPVSDFSRSVLVLGIQDFEIKHTSPPK